MAKPDLQQVYVSTADGELKRLKGKLGLTEALDNLPVLTNSSQVVASGIPVDGLYVLATTHQDATGAVRQRLT